jgi:UDPglucose--hexose-1-phosphate uridylyltransferase
VTQPTPRQSTAVETPDPASPTKTRTQLADGRELVYFDETPNADRSYADERPLPRAIPTSTIRYNAALDEWVALAGHRQDRTYLPPDDECPLCPSRDGRHTEIPSPDYDVVVFENRFPSFAMSIDGAPEIERGSELLAQRPGYGRCEVVCFTSDHETSFSGLPPERVRTVLEAWIDRTRELSELPHVEQVFCFENRGEEIGVTLSHPHGQIYAYPFVTPRTRRMLDNARRYRERSWRNLFADLLAAEVRAGERIVTRSACWTAFVPFAARWPMEVHVYPNRRVADLTELTEHERADFGPVYLDVLRRMEAVHDDTLPYIAAWHQAPVRTGRDLAYAHLQVTSSRRAPGKLKYLAGSESAMGAFVNDVAPERTAAALRDARP